LTSTKIYTRKGDGGKTSLVNGEKVSKSHQRLDAYGSVDELNSVIGIIISHLSSHGFDHATTFLLEVQNRLFNVGSQLACADKTMSAQLPQITAKDVAVLENEMDEMSKGLPPLTQFILPGGHLLASHTHVARAVCRRAERETAKLLETDFAPEHILPYLNRLNDYFFVLARHFNHVLGHNEITWEK
jgi:cob(I)alamin adenosyltransferase